MTMSWQQTGASLEDLRRDDGRLRVGQRYHRVGYPTLVWTVVRVYRDTQGVEHATLINEVRPLDEKTLSVSALRDGLQYRLI